jgi:hypothetical protein
VILNVHGRLICRRRLNGKSVSTDVSLEESAWLAGMALESGGDKGVDICTRFCQGGQPGLEIEALAWKRLPAQAQARKSESWQVLQQLLTGKQSNRLSLTIRSTPVRHSAGCQIRKSLEQSGALSPVFWGLTLPRQARVRWTGHLRVYRPSGSRCSCGSNIPIRRDSSQTCLEAGHKADPAALPTHAGAAGR